MPKLSQINEHSDSWVFGNEHEAEPHRNKLLALPSEMVFETSQSLTSFGQPTIIDQARRIITRLNTLMTSRLLTYRT